jgi:hypothetical protein
VSAPQILATLPLSYRNTDGAAPPFTPRPRSQQRKAHSPASIGQGAPATMRSHPLHKRGARRLLVYVDTRSRTGRAAGRGFRALGRGITWSYSGSCKWTSQNSTSTHPGEVTLGTWLLQYPTHRDHGPTEHGRDASALQVHLKASESSPSLPHTMT